MVFWVKFCYIGMVIWLSFGWDYIEEVFCMDVFFVDFVEMGSVCKLVVDKLLV